MLKIFDFTIRLCSVLSEMMTQTLNILKFILLRNLKVQLLGVLKLYDRLYS